HASRHQSSGLVRSVGHGTGRRNRLRSGQGRKRCLLCERYPDGSGGKKRPGEREPERFSIHFDLSTPERDLVTEINSIKGSTNAQFAVGARFTLSTIRMRAGSFSVDRRSPSCSSIALNRDGPPASFADQFSVKSYTPFS